MPMEVDDDVGATSTTVDPKWTPFLESTGLDRSTIPLIASAHEKVKNYPLYDLLDRSLKAAALRREMPAGRLAEEGHAEQALDVLEPPPPQQHVAWGDLSQATKSLQRKTPPNPLPDDQPRQWIGRDKAELVVKFVAKQNFLKRRTNDHGEFAFLVASGHVRSGKTRTGIETPRLVKEVCTELSQWAHQTTALRFSDPVYLKIDFLNGARFDPLFDTLTLPSSEALGARLVKSFYGDPVPLKRVTHFAALSHIVKWIQRQEESNGQDVVVPIVIHMDEFGDFVKARNVEFADEKGKEFFLNMLRDIGSAATVESIELSKLHNAGKYFIVPITTGTSHSESNIGGISKYGLHSVALPVLNYSEAKHLAVECLRVLFRDRLNLQPWIDGVLNSDEFLIALGDTGGLPGLIYFACSKLPEDTGLSYVQNLRILTAAYMKRNWDHRYESLTCVFLARYAVTEETVLTTRFYHKDNTGHFYESRQHARDSGIHDADVRVTNYTVQDALDGGSAFLRNGTELGLAPAFVAQFNLEGNAIMNPIVLKGVSRAESWTWQDFAKAHLLYLAASMAAHTKVRQSESEFKNVTVTLASFIREARPAGANILALVLNIPTSFNGLMYEQDTSQSIPKSNAKSTKQLSIRTDEFSNVHLAAEGTPIVDAYQNLTLGLPPEPTTMFIQYKHSGLASQTSPVLVSTMNIEVRKLHNRLKKHRWAQDRKWVFLWVTNREVEVDEDPDCRLLWVERTTLAEHAPLLGTRGLVPQEILRPPDD